MVNGKTKADYRWQSSSLAMIVALMVMFLLLGKLPDAADCTRIRLGYSDEPQSAEVYNNFRMLYASQNLYFLKSAGLLNQSKLDPHLLEDKKGPNGHFMRGNFTFNSSERHRKVASVNWFTSLEDRVSMQIYDDPLDRDLATGPQVNQELCGLHLNYMLHLIRKHLINYSNSSELSIFQMMGTFGQPGLALEEGNYIFPGNYERCLKTRLNVMRSELAKVDKQAAEKYFRNRINIAAGTKTNTNRLALMLKTIFTYLGPFIGYPIDNQFVSMDKYVGEIHTLPTRYCIMSLRWPQWTNSSFYRRSFALRTGACLPESCDSNSLKLYHDTIKQLADFKMTNYFSGYYIDQLYCLPDEKSKLRNPFSYTSTSLFIAFNGIWFLLTLIATTIKFASKQKRKQIKSKEVSPDELNTDSLWWTYLSSWCLTKNIQEFLAAKRGRMEESANNEKANSQNGLIGNKVDLEPLEGFKVVSAMSTITSHACMMGMAAVWNQFHSQYILSESWLAMVSIVFPAVVDNFFVVTGIVMGKILFQTPKKVLMAPSFWIKFVFYRYLRIVPLYLFIHWFLKSYFRFIGSGPFWDYGTSHTAWSKVCQDESFWTVILPTVNFKSPAATCNSVGWYLANDIQFSIITPIVIILYLKKPIMGHLTILSAVILLMANHVRYYYNLNADSRGFLENSVMTLSIVTDDATDGYVNPQYRCLSYLIGLAAGYVLVEYERGAIRRWPRWFIFYGKGFFYFILYMLCFIPFITTILPFDNKPLIRWLAALLSGTLHGITSFAAAFFTLLLCTGYMPSIAHLYSMPIFRPLANTSLSIVLVHMPLLFYHSQSLRDLPELSSYHIITKTSTWIIESYLIAIAVHVLYEQPLRKFLIKLMINLFSSAKNSKSNGPRNVANNKSKSN